VVKRAFDLAPGTIMAIVKNALAIDAALKPSATESNQRPSRFDDPERPCALQEAVSGAECARISERRDEPMASIFQRVADKHRGHDK
jgi:hypothetical protein